MNKRRILVVAALLVAAACGLRSSVAESQNTTAAHAGAQLGAETNNRTSQGQPVVDPTPPITDKRALEENAKQIKVEVDRLYELAADLKAEVDKTDTTKVFSTSLTKKAQQIEKLAKDIKSRSKG